jgi:Zn-dependent protease with chaperone function
MSGVFAWLWQGLLLAAVVDLLLRAMPRLNAATRHLAWWGTLAGIILLGAIGAAGGSPAAVPVAAVPRGDPATLPAWPALVLPHAPGWLILSAMGAWLGLVLYRLGVVARGLRHVAALRAASVALDPERATRFSGWWSARGRGGRDAHLRVTDRRVGACALGFRRPVILVSRQWLDTLDDEVLDKVVMHEQAHLDRFDDWLRLVQAVVAAVAAVHPAIHLVGRRIDLEREAACDDRVVSATGAADRYATCLAEAAAMATSRVPAAVPAVLGGGATPGRSLRTRIVRLLDPRPDRGHRVARPAAAAVAACLVAVLVVAPQLPSFVVFVQAAAPALAVNAVHAGYSTAMPEASATAPAPVGTSGRRAGVATVAAAAGPMTPESLEQVDRGQPAAAEAPAPAVSAPTESLVLATLDVPVDTLGVSSVALTADPPRDRPAAGPVPAGGGRTPTEGTLLSDMSWVGRNSAATARKAGLTVAGTVVRAGKAFGRLF